MKWNSDVIVGAQQLVRGANALRGYIDLRRANAAVNARCLVRIGRVDTTSIDVLPTVNFSRMDFVDENPGAALAPIDLSANGSVLQTFHDAAKLQTSGAAAATAGLVTSGTSLAGQPVIGLGSNTGLAVGDIVSFGSTPTSNWEVRKVIFINGTAITLDRPLQFTHSAGESFTNKADLFQVQLEPGCIWEVGFNYRAATTGNNIWVAAIAKWTETY